MTELDQALSTLRSYGLLNRAQVIRAGGFEVQLGPPEGPATQTKAPTPEEERAALEEAMYAASQGLIPGDA